ncbi:MAG: putative nuclease with TOPRIM domain [Phenylobacterium sp.]|jgi:predicted nuclease with TOPRIM domain
MNKTTVDEMLMRIIKPELDDIETRFSAGERLATKDVNTLLLKSQYNHINHLDKKMDEITDTVTSLKGDFHHMEGKFDRLEDKVDSNAALLTTKIESLEQTMDSRMFAFEKSIKLDISEAMNKNMRWSFGLIAILVGALKLADTFAK